MSCHMMVAWFALPVLRGFSFLFFTGRRFFSFSKKRKKRMGAKKMRATNGRPYDVYFGAVKNR